jgi:hypothetical protein
MNPVYTFQEYQFDEASYIGNVSERNRKWSIQQQTVLM